MPPHEPHHDSTAIGAGEYHLHLPSSTEKDETVRIEHLAHGGADVVRRTASGELYKTRNGIELVPTPSDDPDDPLNWPLGWKLLVLFGVCCSSLLIAFCAAGIIPGFAEIVGRKDVPF